MRQIHFNPFAFCKVDKREVAQMLLVAQKKAKRMDLFVDHDKFPGGGSFFCLIFFPFLCFLFVSVLIKFIV